MGRSASRFLLVTICLAVWVGAVTSAVPAGDRLFVLVTPPDVAGPSSIVAFDIGSNGVPVQAESYPTGGNGRAQSSPQDVATDAGSRFLFAANNESHTIAAFTILPDGTLEGVAGSPFPVEAPPFTYSPHYLAVTPDASFLYAAAQGALFAFEISDEGALTPIQSLAETVAEIATSPDGEFLYAAGLYSGGVHAYRITSSGLLEEVDGSPFAYDSNRPWQVVVSVDALRVWVLDLDTGIVAFDAADDGTLHFSAQTTTDIFAVTLDSAANDSFLYAAPPFEPAIYGFAADAAAPVELPASPYPAEYSGIEVLVSPDGSRLFQVTAHLASILPMAIETNGELRPLAPAVAVETGGDTIPNGATYYSGATHEAVIDVRPGSPRNPIQLRARGVIPVAILGSAGLDVSDVDQASVRFGPGDAIPAHRLPHRLADIDGDGDPDVVLHFRTQASGIECGHTTVELTGQTFEGREFSGSDAIRVLGCDDRGRRDSAMKLTHPQR